MHQFLRNKLENKLQAYLYFRAKLASCQQQLKFFKNVKIAKYSEEGILELASYQVFVSRGDVEER